MYSELMRELVAAQRAYDNVCGIEDRLRWRKAVIELQGMLLGAKHMSLPLWYQRMNNERLSAVMEAFDAGVPVDEIRIPRTTLDFLCRAYRAWQLMVEHLKPEHLELRCFKMFETQDVDYVTVMTELPRYKVVYLRSLYWMCLILWWRNPIHLGDIAIERWFRTRQHSRIGDEE